MRCFLCEISRKELHEEGFTLVELVVVLGILATLSTISIPNVLRTIKLNRIDEAKVLMDSYAAECLNEFRLGNDLSQVSPATYSEKKINGLGFTKKVGSSCASFVLEPKNNDDLLFSFDFRIGSDSGTLIKTAIPASNTASKNSCESWAGDLCSSSENEKNSWDEIFRIEKNKLTCDQDFLNWRKLPQSGSHNTWDNTNKTCTKKVWVHKNYIADSESKFLQIKSNEECTTAKKAYSNFTGEKYISDCERTFYFYKGIDMGSNDLMQSKLIEEDEVKCMVNREYNRLNASNGKYQGEASSGKCGNFYWICNKRILTSVDQWKESSCYAP